MSVTLLVASASAFALDDLAGCRSTPIFTDGDYSTCRVVLRDGSVQHMGQIGNAEACVNLCPQPQAQPYAPGGHCTI